MYSSVQALVGLDSGLVMHDILCNPKYYRSFLQMVSSLEMEVKWYPSFLTQSHVQSWCYARLELLNFYV